MNFKELYKSANDNICADRNLIAEIYEKAEKKPGFFIRNYRQFAVCAAGLMLIAVLSVVPRFSPVPSENTDNRLIVDNRNINPEKEDIPLNSTVITDDILRDEEKIISDIDKSKEDALEVHLADETKNSAETSDAAKEHSSKKISEYFTGQSAKKSVVSKEKSKTTHDVVDKKDSIATKEATYEKKNITQDNNTKNYERVAEKETESNYTKNTEKTDNQTIEEEKQINFNEELQVASVCEPVYSSTSKETEDTAINHSAKSGSGGGGGSSAGGGGGSGGGMSVSSSDSSSAGSLNQYRKYIGFDPSIFFNATTDGVTFEKIIRINVDETMNDYFVFDAVNAQNFVLSVNVTVCSEQKFAPGFNGIPKKLSGYDVICQIEENSNRVYFKVKNMCVEITSFGLDYVTFEKYLISVLKKI